MHHFPGKLCDPHDPGLNIYPTLLLLLLLLLFLCRFWFTVVPLYRCTNFFLPSFFNFCVLIWILFVAEH